MVSCGLCSVRSPCPREQGKQKCLWAPLSLPSWTFLSCLHINVDATLNPILSHPLPSHYPIHSYGSKHPYKLTTPKFVGPGRTALPVPPADRTKPTARPKDTSQPTGPDSGSPSPSPPLASPTLVNSNAIHPGTRPESPLPFATLLSWPGVLPFSFPYISSVRPHPHSHHPNLLLCCLSPELLSEPL